MRRRPFVLSAIIAIVIALTAAAGGMRTPATDAAKMHVSARTMLERGRDASQRWIALGSRDSVSASTAIALGYMERLRLGIGSPYRLIDYAIQDPRLDDSTRTVLAWSLLARMLDGDAYDVDAAALDRAGAGAIQSWPGIGTRHLELIRDAIEGADDPRAGELAVRMGYALAATEGSLPLHAPRYAANAAALVRDRALAMEDARDIIREANRTNQDAIRILQDWRAARRLRVEAPPLTVLPQEQEQHALARATRIASELRDLGASSQSLTAHHPDTVAIHRSLLRPVAAAKLAALADKLAMPPLAPLVVGARGYHHELVAQPWLSAEEVVRRRGLEDAASEELFAARYAQLQRDEPYDVVPSLVAMWSAVGMRVMAQEAVWYPGYAAPTSRELVQKFGLKSVSFGASVPEPWRPYYRRMIDVALSDIKSVLPALDVGGLSIRFQEVGPDAGVLALHDPATRKLLLPPSTAAGTLAHEITHDIDWQVALKRYHVRGDYASDRAVQASTGAGSNGEGDRLALRMADLAAGANPMLRVSPRLAEHAKRPTEILARNVDFLVTAALAERGRTDGYLSSVQDELLTGYGTVRAPELTGIAADALVTSLDQIAPVVPDTRDWFLRNYGSGRTLRSYDLVRRVIETELPRSAGVAPAAIAPDRAVFERIAHARSLGDRAIDQWTCRMPDGAAGNALEEARRTVVREAAIARAKGYAIRRARALLGQDAGRWVAGQLNGAPWHVSSVTPEKEAYLRELVDGVSTVAGPPIPRGRAGFHLNGAASNGTPGTFAPETGACALIQTPPVPASTGS
jgi:hypothetical protein